MLAQATTNASRNQEPRRACPAQDQRLGPNRTVIDADRAVFTRVAHADSGLDLRYPHGDSRWIVQPAQGPAGTLLRAKQAVADDAGRQVGVDEGHAGRGSPATKPDRTRRADLHADPAALARIQELVFRQGAGGAQSLPRSRRIEVFVQTVGQRPDQFRQAAAKEPPPF